MASQTSPTPLAFRNVKGGDFRATGADGIVYRVKKIDATTWQVLTQSPESKAWDLDSTAPSKEEAQAVCELMNAPTPVPDNPTPAPIPAGAVVNPIDNPTPAPIPGAPEDTGPDARTKARLDTLREVARQRGTTADDLAAIDEQLRSLVKDAFDNGITVRPIMEATGLSKSRVYQVRDGRR